MIDYNNSIQKDRDSEEIIETGNLIIKIVKDQAFSEIDAKEYIRKVFSERFGNQFEFEVKFTESIPRTSMGKYLYLIQKLPIEPGSK